MFLEPQQMPPVITSTSSRQQTLPPGATVHFVCLSEGLPLPTVSWTHNNGTFLVNTSRILVTNQLLTITNITLMDEGLYQCQADNTVGVTTSLFQLTVNIPLSVVIVSSPLINITQGEQLQLICSVRGLPVPIITWFHNDTLISNDSTTFISFEAPDRSVLTIFNTTLMNGGIYGCQAENRANTVRQSQVVVVQPLIGKLNFNFSFKPVLS